MDHEGQIIGKPRCEAGDKCVVVAGEPENVGTFLTVVQHESNGWLFESASRNMLTRDGDCVTSSWAASGEIYVIRDEYLLPIRGHGQVAEAVIGVPSNA